MLGHWAAGPRCPRVTSASGRTRTPRPTRHWPSRASVAAMRFTPYRPPPRRRVLVVDDNPAVRESFRVLRGEGAWTNARWSALGAGGLVVETACSGCGEAVFHFGADVKVATVGRYWAEFLLPDGRVVRETRPRFVHYRGKHAHTLTDF